jgi:hypothetical protein
MFTTASLSRTGHFIQGQLAWIIEENGRIYKENAQRQASSVACKRIPWKPSHRKQTNMPYYVQPASQPASRPIFMALQSRPLRRHSSYFNRPVTPVLWLILLRSRNTPRRPVSISTGGARSEITQAVLSTNYRAYIAIAYIFSSTYPLVLLPSISKTVFVDPPKAHWEKEIQLQLLLS